MKKTLLFGIVFLLLISCVSAFVEIGTVTENQLGSDTETSVTNEYAIYQDGYFSKFSWDCNGDGTGANVTVFYNGEIIATNTTPDVGITACTFTFDENEYSRLLLKGERVNITYLSDINIECNYDEEWNNTAFSTDGTLLADGDGTEIEYIYGNEILRINATDVYNSSQITNHQVDINGYGIYNNTNSDGEVVTNITINETENLSITLFVDDYFNKTVIHFNNATLSTTLYPYTRINVYSLNGTQLQDLNITYNGQNYTMDGNNGYIPLFNETVNVTIQGNQTYATQTDELTASPYLEAHNFTLYYYNSINILIYDFDNNSLIIESVDIKTIGENTNLSYTNNTAIGNITLKFLAPDNYELRFNSSSHNPTSVFLTVTDDSTNTINVYMQSNETELQIIQVRDLGNEAVEGAIVRLQREYLNDELQWITVQEAETDYNGQTAIYVERDTSVFYRFAVIYDGELRPIQPSGQLYTSKTFFIPDVSETIELVINTQESNINDDLTQWYNVTTSLSIGNTSVNYTFSDANNLISGGKLKIYGKYLFNGTNYILLSQETYTGSDGFLNYSFPIQNNTIYLIEGYITVNGRDYLAESGTKSYSIDVIVNENTGLLFAVIIFFAVACLTAGLFSGLGNRATLPSIALAIASLWIPSVLGFISLPNTIISTLLALAFIMFMRFRTE